MLSTNLFTPPLHTSFNFDLISFFKFFPETEYWRFLLKKNKINQSVLPINFLGSQYLLNMANAWHFIISNLADNEDFNFEFIKNLHKICLGDTPFAFRRTEARREIKEGCDTYDGLYENMQYANTLKEKIIGVIASPGPFNGEMHHFNFDDLDRRVSFLWNIEYKKNHDNLYYIINENQAGMDINEFYLTQTGNELITQLNLNLSTTDNKTKKLTAIFTFLKQSVLHHLFEEEVSDTYSLLSQYLFMRENLLPVLFNTEKIPGHSTKELVDEYLKAEREMQKDLINAACNKTYKLTFKLTFSDPTIFNMHKNQYTKFLTCQYKFSQTKNIYLAKIEKPILRAAL